MDSAPRPKIVKLMYFKPWDWIIGASVYKDEFMEASNRTETLARRGGLILLSVLIFSLVVACLIWFLSQQHRKADKPDHPCAPRQRRAVGGASEHISDASQSLAEGASEQAAPSRRLLPRWRNVFHDKAERR